MLNALKSLHGVMKKAVDVGFGKRARPHLQTIVHGRVEQIDRGSDVDVGPQFFPADGLLKNSATHLASGERPPFAECRRKLRVELGFREQGLEQRRPSLLLNAFAMARICSRILSVTISVGGKSVPEPTRIMKASMTTAALLGQRR